MLTKTRTHVKIARRDWVKLQKNPHFAELVELLEDRARLFAAKKVRGKDISLNEYLRKRGIRNHH